MKGSASDSQLKLFTGTAHPALAAEIGAALGIPVGQIELRRFTDGEAYCQIL
ncbi:MAG: ribose-phosphate pyrophosphokinase-like domain-containing protein, partial [Candidatus Polarisedimenticolia bacterium]